MTYNFSKELMKFITESYNKHLYKVAFIYKNIICNITGSYYFVSFVTYQLLKTLKD